MRAMVLHEVKKPLILEEVPIPHPQAHEVLIHIHACGICRTDLHVVDGDLPSPKLPLIPGHQIVGKVAAIGNAVTEVQIGERVGVPWLGKSCGLCMYCRNNQENLCDQATYTGYLKDGGFAEYCTADSRYIFSLPSTYSDIQIAPLLCAGLIGYRALRMTNGAKRVGFYGFGASAHLLIQVLCYQGREVYAFIRPGNNKGKEFARSMGATWVGESEELPPHPLDAAIVFAPLGELIPFALKAVRKGGIVVCSGIHMTDIPSFPYRLLWEERMLRSVANLTRQDGREFLALAPKIPILSETTIYPLEKANEALEDLRKGAFSGAAVLNLNT